MNFLERIKEQIEAQQMKEEILQRKEKPLSLFSYLKKGNGIIGEFKRATPTRIFDTKWQPEQLARQYEANGFSAISVVVEEKYFLTTADDLKKIKSAVSIPVIQKGFIIHESQIIQARNNGADSVLLIATLVDKRKLTCLLEKCQELQMEPLVEIHAEEDIKKISELPVKIIGINNRDLTSLKIDLSHGERILALLKEKNIGEIRIIESGLKTPEDLKRFKKAGADGFLIGSYFMESDRIEERIMKLLEALRE